MCKQKNFSPVVCESFYEGNNRRCSQDSTDISIEEDVVDGSNIFSDPESEWGIDGIKNEVLFHTLNPSSDSRPEVDQPSVTIS